MGMNKVGMVCFGMALAVHTVGMNFAPYGVERPARYLTEKKSTDRACQSMMNIAFFMYGLAFLVSLFRGLNDDAGFATSTTGSVIVAVQSLLGGREL